MATSRAPKKAAAKPAPRRPIVKSNSYISEASENATVGRITRSSGDQIMLAFEREVALPLGDSYEVQRVAIATITMTESHARGLLQALASQLGDEKN